MGLPKLAATGLYSVEEYLALERSTQERHTYLDGHIFKMSGESEAHGDICVNVIAELRTQLRRTPCRVWTKDAKIRSGPQRPKPGSRKGLFSYPDIVVVCGERQYLDEHRDVLLNPTVIIEVLSPSTEAFDRNEKLRRFRLYLPTLVDYVLIEQNAPAIVHYRRQTDGLWVVAFADGLDSSVYLASINCQLSLEEVYDRVEFPPDEEVSATEPEFPAM